MGSQPGTPRSTPPSPATPQSLQEMGTGGGSPTVPLVDSNKSVVKPGILRYGTGEEFPVGVFAGAGKNQVTGQCGLIFVHLCLKNCVFHVCLCC